MPNYWVNIWPFIQSECILKNIIVNGWLIKKSYDINPQFNTRKSFKITEYRNKIRLKKQNIPIDLCIYCHTLKHQLLVFFCFPFKFPNLENMKYLIHFYYPIKSTFVIIDDFRVISPSHNKNNLLYLQVIIGQLWSQNHQYYSTSTN